LKLVLLPGMDGTGNLFSPLLRELSEFNCEVITLPISGPQDYLTITEFVKGKLPREDFILVAESFSGPIGVALAREGAENMKGIIFVATFLSPPHKILLGFARRLPIKLLSSLPLASIFHKMLFLGFSASQELVVLFQYTVLSLPSSLIKARLSSMQSLVTTSDDIDLPVGYIQATSDRLVCSNKINDFRDTFKKIIIKPINGPHFILQANPVECAAEISELVHRLVSSLSCDTGKL